MNDGFVHLANQPSGIISQGQGAGKSNRHWVHAAQPILQQQFLKSMMAAFAREM